MIEVVSVLVSRTKNKVSWNCSMHCFVKGVASWLIVDKMIKGFSVLGFNYRL